MLKKDIIKLEKIKTEIKKFNGTYEKKTKQGNIILVQKKCNIKSSYDYRIICSCYNNILKTGRANTILKSVADLFKIYKFKITNNLDNELEYIIEL